MVGKVDLTRPILPVTAPESTQPKSPSKAGTEFKQVFEKEVLRKSIQFSKHAKERMSARNINLSDADLTKLNEAVTKASKKGAKESLILFSHAAYIVNVHNQTVITAVDAESMKENVFTNIDSAVIV